MLHNNQLVSQFEILNCDVFCRLIALLLHLTNGIHDAENPAEAASVADVPVDHVAIDRKTIINPDTKYVFLQQRYFYLQKNDQTRC